MEITNTLITAFVGFATAIITSIFSYVVGYRKLKKEFRAKLRIVLINKQMHACEKLWSVLKPKIFTDADGNPLPDPYEMPRFTPQIAQDLINDLMDIFYSPCGLYFSKQIKSELFKLKDFIRDELILKKEYNKDIEFSKSKLKDFRHRFSTLRKAIREEIGVEDLHVTQEGPVD